MTACPICQLPLKAEPVLGMFDCDRCGRFEFREKSGAGTIATLQIPIALSQRQRANLSHKVGRRTRQSEKMVEVLLAELPEKWSLDDPLPTPVELRDELILWVGDNAATYAEAVAVTSRERLAGWLGLPLDVDPNHPDRAFGWLLTNDNVIPFVEVQSGGQLALKLTWNGWVRYDELKRREVTSRTAFMAMKFGYPDLDAVVDKHFKPAVAATGFTLKRVTDGQGAGLIDDQMRVGLRTCRFVIADLTHASRGAYWEGGFGEGLGKPVIYTCRADQWKSEGSHFDTNHLVTVVWDPATIDEAMSGLKATIRATLPDVAKMED